MTYNNKIASSDKTEIVSLLEQILASEVVSSMKIRNFHWNVESHNFSEMHSFFEELYDQAAENIDEIAERIRMLWHKTVSTYREYLELSFLNEESNRDLSVKDMVSWLTVDKETTVAFLRDAIEKVSHTNDAWTEDFMIALMQKHEKNLWMLSSMKD